MRDHTCSTCAAGFQEHEVVPINPGPDKLQVGRAMQLCCTQPHDRTSFKRLL